MENNNKDCLVGQSFVIYVHVSTVLVLFEFFLYHKMVDMHANQSGNVIGKKLTYIRRVWNREERKVESENENG